MKIIDKATRETISYSKWEINLHSAGQSPDEEGENNGKCSDGINRELVTDLAQKIREIRHE